MARISDQMTEPFPAPVAPAISRWVPCSRTSHGDPSSRRPTGQRLQVGVLGDGQGGDDRGEGVAADELQDQEAGPGRADPAQQGAEPVGQVLGPVGEVGGGLAGDQPDGHPVGVPGGADLAEHRDQHLAAEHRDQAGDGEHGQPVPLVVPAPPLAPDRGADEPGERRGPADPPAGEQDGHAGGQDDRAGPSGQPPGQDQDGRLQVQHRVPGQELDHGDDRPDQLDDRDHPAGRVVDGRPPDRRGERVGVVDLGQLLPGERGRLHGLTSCASRWRASIPDVVPGVGGDLVRLGGVQVAAMRDSRTPCARGRRSGRPVVTRG